MSPAGREVTITIDGREVPAVEGEMLHDAARKGDVEIPYFCYEPKLGDPVGACRMCLVEIEGIPKLQTSCSTPVREGMVVHTRTEQVKEAQNSVVEFLLVNHPLDCPVCDKGGECPLQDISYGWGPGKSRVIDEKRHFEKPIELSPLVAIDRERCILCYRCVRFSQEISEDAQLQLIERGDRTYVGTFDDRPYVAPFQGNITDICPVGALTNYTYRFRARPWDIEHAGSVCTICPSQCNVSFTVRDEKVKRVLSRDNHEVDDGWLCDRGRYGFEMFDAPERVRGPRLKSGEIGWETAIAKVAEGLRAASGGRRGWSSPDNSGEGPERSTPASSAVAAIVGDASNEEGFLLQKLMREALGSAHIDSRPSRGPEAEVLRQLAEPSISARVRDIDDAEAILVLGTDPLHSSPILDLRVRKAIRRNGAKLVVATERPTALDGGAEAIARYAPGQGAHFVSELAGAIGGIENIAAPVAATLREAEKVVVIWGERIAREDGAAEALLKVAAATGMADNDGAGLLEIPDTTNARGLREAGCLPDAGPGLVATAEGMSTEEIRAALVSGELTGLILFGADPLRDFPDTPAWEEALTACDFLVSFSMHENATTAKADVVLPLETHAEKDGTVTHPDGRLQRVRPSASRPAFVQPNIVVLTDLAKALGLDTGIDSQPTAFAALTDAVPFYAGITDEQIGGRGLRWQDREGAASDRSAGDSEHEGPGGATDSSEKGPTETGATSRPGYVHATDSAAEAHSKDNTTSETSETVAEGSPDTQRDAPISMVQPDPTPRGVASGDPSATVPPPQGDGTLLLGTYRDLWAGPVTELNPPLKFLTPHQRLEISPQDATRLDLKNGEAVRISQNGSSITAAVLIKERVSEGVVFMAEGLIDGNANALLNGGPVQVKIEKLRGASA
jgi:NADH-quinone oxidoreductase subunit G